MKPTLGIALTSCAKRHAPGAFPPQSMRKRGPACRPASFLTGHFPARIRFRAACLRQSAVIALIDSHSHIDTAEFDGDRAAC